jgi:hypothetical protein
LFFMHIMKTGGFSLATQLFQQYEPESVYGGFGPPQTNPITATYRYLNPRPLAHLHDGCSSRLQVVAGHFPFAARSLLGEDVVTVTILRDPVERVISFLNHAQRFHTEHVGLPLEAIYEDAWYFPRFYDNHAVKMLAMDRAEMLAHLPDDRLQAVGWTDDQLGLLYRWREEATSLTESEARELHHLAAPIVAESSGVSRVLGAPNTAAVDVDDARLRAALANLEQIEIVGLHEEYGAFVDVLSARFRLELSSTVHLNTSQPSQVPEALRSRIARDMEPEIELYEAARRMARRRH